MFKIFWLVSCITGVWGIVFQIPLLKKLWPIPNTPRVTLDQLLILASSAVFVFVCLFFNLVGSISQNHSKPNEDKAFTEAETINMVKSTALYNTLLFLCLYLFAHETKNCQLPQLCTPLQTMLKNVRVPSSGQLKQTHKQIIRQQGVI